MEKLPTYVWYGSKNGNYDNCTNSKFEISYDWYPNYDFGTDKYSKSFDFIAIGLYK